MKKIIKQFLVLIFILSNSQIHAQGFLEIGNQWIYEYIDYSILIGGGNYYHTIESITVDKDTLINDKIYKKLTITEPSPCGIFSGIEYLREENEQVFRLSKNLVDEYLMMDFAAEMPYELVYEAAWGSEVIVTEAVIDSTGTELFPNGMELDIQYMRILNNSSYDDDATYKLSKRIGFIQYGFLFPDIGTGLCDTYLGLQLRCHITQGDTIHFKEGVDCFEIDITNSVNKIATKTITLFPNPTTSVVAIPNGFVVEGVFDFMGRQLVANQSEQVLDLADFSKGIYLIVLKEKKSKLRYVSKMVRN